MELIDIVWLKRDLRLQDHAPLAMACQSGRRTLVCYCFEPSLLNDPHLHSSHQRFIVESLADLSGQLKQQGLSLQVFWCDFITLLESLSENFILQNLYSHEEIGVMSTFQRDQAVARWCRTHGVHWQEIPQYAVQRGHRGRSGWRAFADQFLKQPCCQVQLKQLTTLQLQPEHRAYSLKCQQLPRLWLSRNPHYQPGGEQAAQQQLQHFIDERLEQYSFHISKPHSSRQFSSRLSAYLAYGNLSVRSVLHALKPLPASRHRRAFYSRMRWHCHFVQKFESDCRIEFEPLNPAYQRLLAEHQQQLDPVQQQELFAAWAEGQTGLPLVDACMRALLSTGFVNFRMRAMLVSVACHHLQLDWKAVALHLAQHFLDFDPGIHYPQIQMQAGMTGFNTLRIYNPVQQSLKQDAETRFITEFVPELRDFPTALRHQPWLMTPLEAQMFAEFAEGYVKPVVDIQATGRAARERLWRWRESPAVQAAVPRLLRTQVSGFSAQQLASAQE